MATDAIASNEKVRDTRIILVEGMPGTGKSTVSQFINLQLHANGHASYWCHEEHAAHPVRLFYDGKRHDSWSNYCVEAASRWENFAQQLQARNQIAVLDASVLQNHARSMLLFGCESGPILKLARKIEQILASLRPVWIYLKPDNVERNFRDIVAIRGELLLDLWIQEPERLPYGRRSSAKGFPCFIAFWEKFGEIADRVFSELTISKLRQNVSHGDWGTRSRDILRFLDLPSSSDSSVEVLERFTGKYRQLDEDVASEFILHARSGCLVISCANPTMDVQRGPIGCFRDIRLIPKGKNRFYVEAWPHHVEFMEDEMTATISMRLSVSEDGWAPCSKIYLMQKSV